MVLRVLTRRDGRRRCDGSSEESASSFASSLYYNANKVIPPPPTFARPLIVAQPEHLSKRVDYSLCREQVDHLQWPGEQRPKRDQKFPRLLILDIIEGRYCPRPTKASDPQDIRQRRILVEDIPVYNSENTAQWRSPLSTMYPDVREERTWISYRDPKLRRDMQKALSTLKVTPPRRASSMGLPLSLPRHGSEHAMSWSRGWGVEHRHYSLSKYGFKKGKIGEYPMASSWGVEHRHHSPSKYFSKGEVGEYPMATSSSEVEEMETLEKEIFSVEEAIQAVGFGTFQGLLLLYAGMAWTAEAMEMMLLSFVGPAVKDVWDLSPREQSYITSAVFVGMMIGAYSWGFLSDAKGRRVGFFATSVLTFAAGLLSAFCPNYMTLLLLRGLVGVGLGGGPVISTWFMEFVPSANRGLWMIIMSFFWTLGSIVEALLAWNVMPGLGWRWLLGLSSLPLAVLLIFYPLVPESPRYLASKGEFKRATDVLQKMAHSNNKPLPAGTLTSSPSGQMDSRHEKPANLEYDQKYDKRDVHGSEAAHLLQDSSIDALPTKVAPQPFSSSTELQVLSKFSTLLSPGVRQSTLLLWSVFFANAFTYYGLVLLSTQLSSGGGSCAGDLAIESSAQSSVAAAGDNLYRDVLVTSIAELPGLGVAASIVDVYGRKRSMTGLFTLCGVFMLPLIQHQSEAVTTALLFGARASIMGAFTVLYIYAPEVYPTGLRSAGLGIANSFARVGGLVCPLVAVELVQSCQQSWAAALFAGIPMTAGLLVLNFPTETKGQALSDSFGE